MPIVDPGPFWKVDFALDHAMTEFSHSLDPYRGRIVSPDTFKTIKEYCLKFLYQGTRPMILVGQYDSPVTRRVAIALHHYGMPFTRDTRSIFGDAAAIGKVSPLTRIPALVLDDGEVLIDSAAILDHLDEQAADAVLIPTSGAARRLVLQMTALAQGTLEKVAAVVYERHFHAAEHRSTDWLDRCLGQARAGLDELTRRLATPYACGATLTHADVMITTLIWYMQDRMDEVLSPNAHASLITLAEHCETLPAFHAAALSDFEMMPRS